MPSLSAPDRRLLWFAVAFALVFLVATSLAGPGDDEAAVPSIYSTESGGARAAWLLLRDLHYDVHVWDQAPTHLNSLPAGSLLILAEPAGAPETDERKSLRSFVEKGGRVLFCGASIPAFFSHANVAPSLVVRPWSTVAANLPGPITRNAREISIRPDTYWRDPTSAQIPLYGDQGSAVVISWRLGDGEVLWWASATPLTNAGITKAGNLNFFLNSIAGALPTPGTIYWDEYFHGERPTLASYMQRTPLLWVAVQVGIVILAVLFTFSRRSGPVVMPAGVSRLSPLEFVDTMGALYQHAKANRVPVEVSYRHFRLEMTRRLGLSASISDQDLARIASTRLGSDNAALEKALLDAAEIGSRGYGTAVQGSEALTIVQRLEAFLVPPNSSPREIH